MSLILPPWYFTQSIDNLQGTPAATQGTNFTAAANNADGTAVEVLADLTFDCCHLVVGIGGISLATADSQCLLDVLTDPTGSTSYGPFIDDLVCGFSGIPAADRGISRWYHFPVWIPATSAIAVRARTAHTGNITTGRVVMFAFGEPSRPEMWWCGQKVESLGINAASSKGTDVTPGDSGAYGSWTTIGTSTARYGSLQYGVNGSDATSAALLYHWEVGSGSTKLPGSPTKFTSMNTNEGGEHISAGPIWCDVASGTIMQMRGKASGASAEIHNCAVYGVY